MASQVQLQRGKDHAVLNGTVTGHEYHDYVLRARAGQTMAYFNVLPPGSDSVAIFNGSMSADGSGSVKLPKDGDYRICVYLMGNDKDANKTVGYSASMSIK